VENISQIIYYILISRHFQLDVLVHYLTTVQHFLEQFFSPRCSNTCGTKLLSNLSLKMEFIHPHSLLIKYMMGIFGLSVPLKE
jgi:hypothetical protein